MASSSPRRKKPLRRSLRLSLVDGMLHAAMVGASESFLGALAVELGHTGTSLAVLSTLPLLAGALAQIVSPHVVRRVGSVERFVVVGAVLQALSHVGLAAVALTGSRSLAFLLAAKLAFWISGSMIGPGWGTWIADLTRGIDRPTWLARRTSLVHSALVASFVAAGLFLNGAGDALLSRLAILHVVATVFRLGSAAALSGHVRMRRPTRAPGRKPPMSSRRFAIPLLMAGVWFAVSMTSPFFTPYMLRDLHLSYAEFTFLLAAAIVGRAAAAPTLPWVLRRIGLRGLIVAGAVGIAATPGFWALTRDYQLLFASQILSGACWAAYDYAAFQLLLESAGPEGRLRFLSFAGFFTMAAGVAGALVGGRLLESGVLDWEQLFGWGSAVRVVPLFAFVFAGRITTLVIRPVILRLETVRPGAGMMARPVSIPDEETPVSAENPSA